MYTGIPSQRTISQRQYQYRNHETITQEKSNFFYVFTPSFFLYFFFRNLGSSVQEFLRKEKSKKSKKSIFIKQLDCNARPYIEYFFAKPGTSNRDHNNQRENAEIVLEVDELIMDAVQGPPAPAAAALAGSAFRVLDAADQLSLVLDLVGAGEALCIALVCTEFRDAIFARFPAGAHVLYDQRGPQREPVGARRLLTSVVEDMSCSASRFAWVAAPALCAGDERRGPASWALPGQSTHCEWLRGWGADVARRLAAKGALAALQWARAHGLYWDAGACRAAVGAVHSQRALQLRRYAGIRRVPSNPDIRYGDWYLQRVSLLGENSIAWPYGGPEPHRAKLWNPQIVEAVSPEHMHVLAWLLAQKCDAQPEPALTCGACAALGYDDTSAVTIATAADILTDVFDTRQAAHRHGRWRLACAKFAERTHMDLPRRAYDLPDAVGQVPSYNNCSNGEQEMEVIRVRVTAETLARVVPLAGGWSPSSENSWFPPYEWTPCTCAGGCGEQIGFLFTPPPGVAEDASLQPFFGLDTHMLESEDDASCPQTAAWAYPQPATEIDDVTGYLQEAYSDEDLDPASAEVYAVPLPREQLMEFAALPALPAPPYADRTRLYSESTRCHGVNAAAIRASWEWARAHPALVQCAPPPDARLSDRLLEKLQSDGTYDCTIPASEPGDVQVLGWVEGEAGSDDSSGDEGATGHYRVRQRGRGCAALRVRPASLQLADGTAVVAAGLGLGACDGTCEAGLVGCCCDELNGTVGTVAGWYKGRYRVEVNKLSDGSVDSIWHSEGWASPLRLRPANCRPVGLPAQGAVDDAGDHLIVD
jgi:hypothetical protein